MLSDRAFTRVVAAVVVVWAANFAAGVAPFLNYKPDQGINGVMLLVMGSAMTIRAKDKDRNTK